MFNNILCFKNKFRFYSTVLLKNILIYEKMQKLYPPLDSDKNMLNTRKLFIIKIIR